MDVILGAIRLAMKSSKDFCGLNPKDKRIYLKCLGYELGHSFSKFLKSKNLEDLIDELSFIWKSYSLGRLDVSSLDPLILEIYDCYDCLGNRYGIGVTLCPFKEGFLKSIFKDKLGLETEVEELDCCGTFCDHCIFRVKF